jgi:Transcriptional regulator, AbiEi antitoxin
MPDDAVSAVAELAASQHRAFTRRQAAELSFDRSRIATAKHQGWLTEPYPGVLLVVGAPATWHQLAMAATLSGGGHAVASHRAAARLHRLDGFGSTDIVEVSVPTGHRWRGGGGVVAHHVQALDKCDIVSVDGIRCTGLARTLADLGSVVESLLVRRALTDARRRGTSLKWIQLTADRLHRPGQAGTGVLLRQLATIPFEGHVPGSWFEELLALCLDDPAIPPIVPQCPIRDRSGRLVAVTDVGVPSVRLGLEAHSRAFHFGPDLEPLDEQRDLAAGACGWQLHYLGWFATRRPAEVLAVVKEIIAARRREV